MDMTPWDISKIWRTLYQGAAPPYGDLVARKGFDVLVLTATDNANPIFYHNVSVIVAPGDDDERPHRLQRFLPAWEQAGVDVAAAVNEGKKVLVTCMAGQNRSGLVAAIALNRMTGWSGQVCLDHIRSRRPFALSNKTFADYVAHLPVYKQQTDD